MALLSDAERDLVRTLLGRMTAPVTLHFHTQTIGCETCDDTRRVLQMVADLGEKVRLEEHNLVLERETAPPGVDRAPFIRVTTTAEDGSVRDDGVWFAGAPFGYAFSTLLDAILLVSNRETGLSQASRDLLAHVTSPMTIQVFSTPT